MKVKFKKLHPLAVTPTKAHPSDAGFDLTAIACKNADDFSYIEYSTGIATEIPAGHVGLIFPRSSISRVYQMLSNHVGVIDSGYRGEIIFRFRDTNENSLSNLDIRQADKVRYQPGDKIGQLIIIPIPEIELEEVEELSPSDRGNNGFGSSGK